MLDKGKFYFLDSHFIAENFIKKNQLKDINLRCESSINQAKRIGY
jgi:hypothetical protein